MAQGPLGSLLGDIRRLYEDGASGCQSDAQLLERFQSLGDRGAFEALVGRHGRMVLAVCREVLGSPDDAEDAFQATFLVLARKAGSLRVGRTLAGWLHRVGYRVAVQASIAACRRRRHEERAAVLAADAVERPADAIVEEAESRRVLHAELDRLPDRLRIPIVLYYLEGRSYAEASSLLGVPEATVRGRLARARARLRDRLTDRGIAPAEASGLLVLPLAPAIPAVPPGLMSLTARAASWGTLAPAGGTAASLVLMREVLGIMILSKLKVAGAGIAAVLALAWMTASLAAPAAQDEPRSPANVPAPPSTAKPAAGAVVHYAGRVLGPDDRPIEGATISMCYTFDARSGELNRIEADRGHTSITFERATIIIEPPARTDAAGRFQFALDPSHIGKYRGDLHIQSVDLCATAKGYGPVCVAAGYPPAPASAGPRRSPDRIEFRLPRDDVPIIGTIVDGQGRPVPGVTVTPVSLNYRLGPRGEPLDWTLRGSAVRPNVNVFIPPAVTDAQGQFRLTGIGRERGVLLRIARPGTDPEEIEVITRPGHAEPTIYPESMFHGQSIIRYNSAEFVYRIPDPESRIRTMYVWVRSQGRRAESLRVMEWLTKQISQGTKLRVVGNPEEADLILQGTINKSRRALPDPPAGPHP